MHSTIFQIFGANTDVGKTVVSAGLLRAALAGPPRRQATYIKPLQTGDVHDGTFVQRYAPKEVRCHTLYSWSTPISPHLAAAKEVKTVTGEDLLAKLQAHLQQGQETEEEEGGKESQARGITLVETAGGVLSPGPSSALQTQADLYRPLRLPVLLVGDGRLGGISTTLAAYESLYSRGYDVHAIAILDSPDHLDNASAVRTYINVTLGHPTLPVVSLPPLPPYPTSSSSSFSSTTTDATNGDDDALAAWYQKNEEPFRQLLSVLVEREQARVQRLRAMPDMAAEVFWYPFTQHRGLNSKHLHVVDSAYGDHYSLIEKEKEGNGEGEGGEDGCFSRRLIDACASWWTQGLGHGRADVALAIGAAAGRYGHVIFPGNVHEPALRLAELMLAGPGKGWAKRVFFSDNGSTAMEIAVKMALKKASSSASEEGGEGEEGIQVAVVTQRDCYHGDTLGCMDAAAPTVFNTGQHPWYQPRTLSLAVPTIGYVQGQLQVEVPPEIVAASSSSSSYSSSSMGVRVLSFPGGMATLLDLPARETSEAADMYRRAIQVQMDAFEAEEEGAGGQRRRRLGAVLLEPVLMGAAGMILVDPLFQRLLTLEGRARGLPVVFDEVASGLHRLGCASAAELLGVTPDIACYGKTLTGGYLPLALTLTTEAIFKAFHGPAKSDALLHGHSYTANPLACAAAVRALEAYEAMHADRDQQQHSNSSSSSSSSSHRCVYYEGQVAALSQIDGVRRAVALGTVLAVELEEGEGGQGGGYGSTASAHVVQDLKRAGVYARPLGNVVYLLASQVALERTTQILIDTLEQVLRHRATPAGAESRLEGNGGVVI